MPKIDLQQINRGRALHQLMSHPGWTVLEAEWKERIETNKTLTLTFQGGTSAGHAALPHFQEQYAALNDLREWIDEQIQSGAEELRKQQAAEAKVTAD